MTALFGCAAEEDPNSRFGGLGIQIGPRVGAVEVGAVAIGYPADKAGISPGDWITEIAGQPIRTEEINDLVSQLRGATGTVVKIVVVSAAGMGRREVTLTRQFIEPQALTWRFPPGAAVPPAAPAVLR